MVDKITIEINGEEFTSFETVSVTKSIETFNGGFRFTGSSDEAYNIENDSACQIFVNEESVINGYIENLSPSIDAGSHIIDFSGRDRTIDLSDSSLGKSRTYTGGTTLKKVIRQTLDDLSLTDIKVINNVSGLRAIESTDIVDASPDENAFEFINKYATKLSVLLITNGDGNIVITRAGSDVISDSIVNLYEDTSRQNNVISSSANYDNSIRYNKIKVIAQGNMLASGTEANANSVNISGTATDSAIRASRQLIIQSQTANNSTECAEIATYQANIRRAKAFGYSAEINGFSLNNGSIWNYNKLVNVTDEPCGVSSQLLIKSINYDYNAGSGSQVSMDFALRDAYTLQAELDTILARQNKTEELF